MRYLAISTLLSLQLLAACGGPDKPDSAVTPSAGGAPIALAPSRTSQQSIVVPINQDELAKAVERVRITRKKNASAFEQAGADLNSDGQADALALLTGPDWCSAQGCTLVVFQAGETGFRPVSQTIGVRQPIAAGAGSNAGWRDLIVKSGAGKPVRLQFTGGGYPTNAAQQPDATSDLAQAEILIAPPGPAIAAAPSSPQAPPTQ